MLLNGNLVFPSQIAKFTLFVSCFNLKYAAFFNPIIVINNLVRPTLNDLWVLGLTDAEGCFYFFLSDTSNMYRMRYCVAQKGLDNKLILDYLINFFGAGKVYAHSAPIPLSFKCLVGLTALRF